jgi:hypothetical protein
MCCPLKFKRRVMLKSLWKFLNLVPVFSLYIELETDEKGTGFPFQFQVMKA